MPVRRGSRDNQPEQIESMEEYLKGGKIENKDLQIMLEEKTSLINRLQKKIDSQKDINYHFEHGIFSINGLK